MLLGTIGATLLGNILTGKGVIATSQGREVNRARKGREINRAGKSWGLNKASEGVVRADYGNKKLIFNAPSSFN